jgi:hypothetical protein
MRSEPAVLSISYRLDLSLREMSEVLVRDEERRKMNKPTLFAQLVTYKAIWEVDYSGHYGPAVFYRVLREDDNTATHAKVRTIIRRFLRQ